MKMILLVLSALFATVSNLEAQDFQAFTKRPVSQEEYAKACEANDMNILNVNCDQIIEAMNKRFTGLNLSSRQAFADFIRRLDARPCPQIRTSLSRVDRRTKLIDLAGRERDLRPGETCLSYQNEVNDTVWVLSLLCGNIFSNDLPAPAPVAAPAVVKAAEPQTPIRDAVIQTGKVEVDVNHRFPNTLNVRVEGDLNRAATPSAPAQTSVVEHGHSRWWVIPLTVAVVAAGTTAVICAARDDGCFRTIQTVTYGP